MSRIEYPSRSPRRYSPIKYRSQRSRSRDRYLNRRSPFNNNNRNRVPVHQRLSDRSRSIEKRLSYPSKHEVEKRSIFRRSRSPRRRRRSSTRSDSRHRSRSGSRRRSRLESRSRSKERDERAKFRYYTTTSEVNEGLLLSKPEDNYMREFNLSTNSDLVNQLNNFNYLQQQSLLDKSSALLDQKVPLLDKPQLFDNQFNEDIYYDNQINHQLNQINQLKMNNPINNLFINQPIPNETELMNRNNDFHSTNTSNLSRALRERLDVVHPTTSNALLETPTYINPSTNNHSINTFNNNLNNTNQMTNPLSHPMNLNSSGNLNLHHNNNLHSNNMHPNNMHSNSALVNNLDNGFYNNLSQDIDLRGSNNNNLVFKDSLLGNAPNDPNFVNQQQQFNNNQDQNEKCMFSHLGCPITTNKDVISKHELECLYNPRNVKAFCNKCKLTVNPEHDCITELRTELNQIKTKTNWCQNTIKLTNTSLLSNDFEPQVISIHYSMDNKEIVKQIKIQKQDRIDFILKQAVDLIFTKESLMRLNKTDRDFQLIFTGLYTFLPEITFNKSTKLQLPSLDNQLHLVLIEKKVTVKVAVKRLFYQNQHIIVSVPASVPFCIDPTKRVCDLKELISEKIPVQWDKHRLTINCKEYKDYQILYSIGLSNGDRVEIEAY